MNQHHEADGVGLGSVPTELQNKITNCPQFNSSIILQTWERFPCSLYFAGATPSSICLTALEKISNLLGPFGEQQGEYGAGGGGVHIMYFGIPPSGEEIFPRLEELVQMMHLADSMGPPVTQWMATLDPRHQMIFTHEPDDYSTTGNNEDSEPPLLQRLYALITSEIHTRPYTTENAIDAQVVRDFPFLTEARLLFVLPRFNRISGGTILESTAAGERRDAGEIFECPCHAVFQLEDTGEVLSLVNFDYRD